MRSTLTEGGLARFDEVAGGHVGDDRVPGLVALVARGEEVHVSALGSLSVGGPPVTRSTPFRIASTTKPITGAATLAVAAEGLVDLDEPVDRLLPELAQRRVLRRPDGPLDDTVPARRAITVRDLLTFRFGFGMVGEMFAAPEPWPAVQAARALQLAALDPPSPGTEPGAGTWIARFASLPLLFQPGERWCYNTGAQVLGVLLARAAGVPLDELLRTRLFEPLGMSGTAFWAKANLLPTAYAPGPGGLSVWDPPDGQWSRPPAFCDAAAGLVSTVDDLLAFARMLLRGGSPVLATAAVAEMTRDQLTPTQRAAGATFLNGAGWGFCVGVAVDGPRAGSFGWDGGLGTSWVVDPVRDLIVIVLTQRLFEGPSGARVHRDLQDAAYAALAE
ncbi:MAG TPA: serine hydrolase domain-containing protein [Actinomycetota bacterium]|nr:serine hydrolase domain-containing protein [Actinomycetota bacterium]